MVDAATLGFAFGLGVGSFFSPCSVALVPAYVAYYSSVPGEAARSSTGSWLRGLGFGAAASLGAFTIFGGAGALIYYLRTETALSSPALARALAVLGVLVALAVIAFGILLLMGRDLSITFALHAPTTKTTTSMFAFGALYSLASLGCSGPLFLAAMAQVFSQGPLGGLLVLVLYGLGLSLFLLASAVALSVAREGARTLLRGVTRYAKPVSGLVMVFAGVYVVVYYVWIAPPG